MEGGWHMLDEEAFRCELYLSYLGFDQGQIRDCMAPGQ